MLVAPLSLEFKFPPTLKSKDLTPYLDGEAKDWVNATELLYFLTFVQ